MSEWMKLWRRNNNLFSGEVRVISTLQVTVAKGLPLILIDRDRNRERDGERRWASWKGEKNGGEMEKGLIWGWMEGSPCREKGAEEGMSSVGKFSVLWQKASASWEGTGRGKTWGNLRASLWTADKNTVASGCHDVLSMGTKLEHGLCRP